MAGPGSTRNIIHIISRFSNWSKKDIAVTLKSEVYASKQAWLKFLEIFLAVTGFLLVTAGIIFFFAYNWDDLSAMQKFILIQVLLAVSCGLILLKKIQPVIKKVILSAAAIMVGALWAVFGQVYQTGADTFDFYSVWLLCILAWILVSGFPPLWAIGVVLLNLAIHFYFIKDHRIWHESAQLNIHFILNVFLFVLIDWFDQRLRNFSRPGWFAHFLAAMAVFFLTLSVITGIQGHEGIHFSIAIILLLVFFSLYILRALRLRLIFPIALTGLSLTTIISSWLLKDFSTGIVLVTGLFIAAATTALILLLVNLNKRWHVSN